MVVFVGHLYVVRHSIFGEFFKLRIDNQIYNFFTAFQYFLFKRLVDKNRGFAYPEIQLTRVNITKLIEKSLIFFLGKIFVECFSQSGNHELN